MEAQAISSPEIKQIFVAGAGTMGNGIAQVAATSGFQVTLMDVVPEQLARAQATIENRWINCSRRKRSPLSNGKPPWKLHHLEPGRRQRG